MVKPPFEMTRTLPEFYRVLLFGIEETIQLVKNGYGVGLIWVQFAIKNFLHSMDGIGDNNDFDTFSLMQAWLILYLIVNNSAFILVTNAA